MVQLGSEYSLEVSKSVPNRNVRLTLRDSSKSITVSITLKKRFAKFPIRYLMDVQATPKLNLFSSKKPQKQTEKNTANL